MSPNQFPPFETAVSVAVLLGLLALLSLAEAAFPFRQPRGDGGRKWTNVGLLLLYFLVNFLLMFALVKLAGDLTWRGLDLPARIVMPNIAWLGIAIVTLDFCAWLAHWLMHKIPALWRVHRVHHSDVHVDATTAFRQHPIEGLWRFGFTLGPALLLGLPPAAVAGYRLLSGVNALIEHMNVALWPWLDRALLTLLVTPQMHKVHHSRAPAETDSNYGNLLSVYDWLFGAFTPTKAAQNCVYGLDGLEGREGLAALLTLRFARAA